VVVDRLVWDRLVVDRCGGSMAVDRVVVDPWWRTGLGAAGWWAGLRAERVSDRDGAGARGGGLDPWRRWGPAGVSL